MTRPRPITEGAVNRVPFGFELDFFTDRAGVSVAAPLPARYEIPCRVHGAVLVGDERIEVDGWGQRDHSWGAARDWWVTGVVLDGVPARRRYPPGTLSSLARLGQFAHRLRPAARRGLRDW